jgi:hypothetical protein
MVTVVSTVQNECDWVVWNDAWETVDAVNGEDEKEAV